MKAPAQRSFAELSSASTKSITTKKSAFGKLLPAPCKTTAPVEISVGRSGDHADLHRLLLNVFHAPLRDEFHAWSEKPGYDPNSRLLVKRGEHVVSHLLTTDYRLRFGATNLPVKQLHWLATLPEQREQGLAGALLNAADARMRETGSVLGMLRTTEPHYFARHGWAACVRETSPRCCARDVLGRLSRRATGRDMPLSVRYWRHVELPALMRMYDRFTADTHGAVVRSEDDWRWLLSRKAFDHILVAIHGRDRFDLEDTRAPLVGYAVMRGQRIVEFVVDPNYPTAAEQLLGLRVRRNDRVRSARNLGRHGAG
ncbi:MAG: GNAT family N-acetyltransferase [Pirellulales bacterium]